MPCDYEGKCESLKVIETQVQRHEEILSAHERQLNKGNVDFAVIKTKLNIILGVVGAIGIALIPIILNLVFQ